jgi:hypothetical protein
MATLRGSSSSYSVGNNPPRVTWTVVRGDTAAFRVYVTDDSRAPVNVPDWSIEMKIKRPVNPVVPPVITDNATTVLTLNPSSNQDDAAGEFTVSITAAQSQILETGDIFDIQLSLPQDELVWTVAQGSMIILEDVTD